MSLWLHDPLVERAETIRVLQTGEDVGITNPGQKAPITILAKVTHCGEKQFELSMSEHYQDSMQFQQNMSVQITKVSSERMYYIEGQVQSVAATPKPQVVIKYSGKMISAQRRLFYRFELKKRFNFRQIELPDGNRLETMEARLTDMSPSGIGFKISSLLPQGTVVRTSDLFEPVIESMKHVDFYIEIVWCRGNSLMGYRCGGIFKFPTEQEQDSFGRILSQLQINRLSWYYHNYEKFK